MSKLIVFEKTDGVVSFTSHPVYDMEENMFTSDPALQRCWMLVSDDGSRVLAEGGDLGIIRPQKTIFEPIEIQKWVEGLMPKRGGAEPVGASPDYAKKLEFPFPPKYVDMENFCNAFPMLFLSSEEVAKCRRMMSESGAVRTGEDVKPAPADEPLDNDSAIDVDFCKKYAEKLNLTEGFLEVPNKFLMDRDFNKLCRDLGILAGGRVDHVAVPIWKLIKKYQGSDEATN